MKLSGVPSRPTVRRRSRLVNERNRDVEEKILEADPVAAVQLLEDGPDQRHAREWSVRTDESGDPAEPDPVPDFEFDQSLFDDFDF